MIMNDKNASGYLKCCILNECKKPGCDNYDMRKDLMQKIVDGQASPQEQLLYEDVVSRCDNCQCKKYCEDDLAIKSLMRSKLDRKRVPIDILEKIRTEIIKTP
jgi:hypothetical protein